MRQADWTSTIPGFAPPRAIIRSITSRPAVVKHAKQDQSDKPHQAQHAEKDTVTSPINEREQ